MAVGTRPVVHVALHAARVITKLQEDVRSVLSSRDGSAVVQFTEDTTRIRLTIYFTNLLQFQYISILHDDISSEFYFINFIIQKMH